MSNGTQPTMVVRLGGEAVGEDGSQAVSSAQKQYAGVPSGFSAATAEATVFTLAAGEFGFIQNLSTNPLFVKLGATASAASFSFVLKAATAEDDGTGGQCNIKDHIGIVSVAGTTPRYIAWKRATE